MKKLFAIAIAVSLVGGGLFGFSFGLGAAYENIGGPEGTDPFFAIKADVMCKPLPILGLRIGIVDVDLKSDDMGGTTYAFGTGCDATVLLYIPMAGMIQPYIPFYFMYAGNGFTSMHFAGGLGAEFALGGVNAFLEAKFDYYDFDVEGFESDAENSFNIYGGVRIPLNM